MFTGDLTVSIESEDAEGSCKSQAIARDSTRLLVQWEQGNCFAALSGKPAQLQFKMQVRTQAEANGDSEWALILNVALWAGRGLSAVFLLGVELYGRPLRRICRWRRPRAGAADERF